MDCTTYSCKSLSIVRLMLTTGSLTYAHYKSLLRSLITNLVVSLSNHGEGVGIKTYNNSKKSGVRSYNFPISSKSFFNYQIPKVSNNLQSGNTTYIAVVILKAVVHVIIVEIDVLCIARTLGVCTRAKIIIN